MFQILSHRKYVFIARRLIIYIAFYFESKIKYLLDIFTSVNV